MMLRIYDTLSGQKTPFEPIEPGKVGIYVCGPTVYDMAHIGHARAYVAFDVVVRYLRRHFDVTYVRNYTDIDDKIIARANEASEDPKVLSERFIAEFLQDMDSLGNKRPDVEPKVTTHLDSIISLIQSLIDRGFAYESEGDVYFAVRSFDEYGKLSKRNLEDMQAGARVLVDEKKKDPMDFALWKKSKSKEPSWESPFGPGRPGWHIECSAMSRDHLKHLDIHGGGKDLIFPHHENEIAQSEASGHTPYARFWMHNGFVNLDNQKMSKSLGNFFTIRDVLEKFDAQSVRYLLLSVHYRSPINFSDAGVEETEKRVRYINETLGRLHENTQEIRDKGLEGPYRRESVGAIISRFEEAMNDDFNTAKALADLSDIFKLVNEVCDKPNDPDQDARTLNRIRHDLEEIGEVLGFFLESPESVLARMDSRTRGSSSKGLDEEQILDLIRQRNEARSLKDFAAADSLRDRLLEIGVAIKDSQEGTTWEILRP